SQTTPLRLTLRPHLFLSSTRCPATEWTTYSPPIHQPRIGLPRSKNYRSKWVSAVSVHQRSPVRHRAVPGDERSSIYEILCVLKLNLIRISERRLEVFIGVGVGSTVCRQSISDSWLGNLRECLAHLV